MGIFGIKREEREWSNVKKKDKKSATSGVRLKGKLEGRIGDIKRKRQLEALKERQREVKAEKYRAKMSRKIEKTTLKRDLERLKAQRLEAKVSKREARSELWSIPVIGSKRRRKKQGRALSSKRRIGLF
jgi:hypothetical protein